MDHVELWEKAKALLRERTQIEPMAEAYVRYMQLTEEIRGAEELANDPELGAMAQEELPLYRDWAVDWQQGRMLRKNGRPYLVEGQEALKIYLLPVILQIL